MKNGRWGFKRRQMTLTFAFAACSYSRRFWGHYWEVPFIWGKRLCWLSVSVAPNRWRHIRNFIRVWSSRSEIRENQSTELRFPTRKYSLLRKLKVRRSSFFPPLFVFFGLTPSLADSLVGCHRQGRKILSKEEIRWVPQPLLSLLSPQKKKETEARFELWTLEGEEEDDKTKQLFWDKIRQLSFPISI